MADGLMMDFNGLTAAASQLRLVSQLVVEAGPLGPGSCDIYGAQCPEVEGAYQAAVRWAGMQWENTRRGIEEIANAGDQTVATMSGTDAAIASKAI